MLISTACNNTGFVGHQRINNQQHHAAPSNTAREQHIGAEIPAQYSFKLSKMPDDNLAIILTLFLLFIVIGVGAWFGRKWIKAFTTAMVQAKQAERDNAV